MQMYMIFLEPTTIIGFLENITEDNLEAMMDALNAQAFKGK